MKEEYRKIKEFDGIYSISNLRNIRRNRSFINRDGVIKYKDSMLVKKGICRGVESVQLMDGMGKYYRRSVNSLMEATFPEINISIEPIEKGTHVKNNKTKVLQYSVAMVFMNRFDSLNDAAKKTGINKSLISSCCSGKTRKTHGWIFRYDDVKVNPKT